MTSSSGSLARYHSTPLSDSISSSALDDGEGDRSGTLDNEVANILSGNIDQSGAHGALAGGERIGGKGERAGEGGGGGVGGVGGMGSNAGIGGAAGGGGEDIVSHPAPYVHRPNPYSVALRSEWVRPEYDNQAPLTSGIHIYIYIYIYVCVSVIE